MAYSVELPTFGFGPVNDLKAVRLTPPSSSTLSMEAA